MSKSGPGWRPIATAPLDGSVVLLCEAGDDDSVASGSWHELGVWVHVYGDVFFGPPTHWMPLPAAAEKLAEAG